MTHPQRHLRLPALTAGLLALAVATASAAPKGILIEAEAFDKKVSEKMGRFAAKTSELAGSGGCTLMRFGEPGRLIYEFEAPADGLYRVWLRYGVNDDTTLSAAMNPDSDADFRKTTLPGTGGYIGKGVWGWAKIAEARLEAGGNRLVVQGAWIRPDCFFITTSDETPTDAVTDIPEPRELTAAERELLKNPYVPVTPDWVEEATGYELPAWYDDWRVHAHIRLWPQMHEDEIFLSAAKHFRSLGFHVYTRHLKSRDEGAWWPSKVGGVEPWAEDRNWAKEIIDNAHRENCRIIAYYRHMEDKWASDTHPEWRCLDWLGRPVPTPTRRGIHVCYNSPFPDFMEARLLEVVEMGADGIFFDESHMPKTGCWCDYCKKRFKEETGLDHPAVPEESDPLYQRLIDFKNVTIERTFVQWRKAIHDANPDCVLVIGSNTYPAWHERHQNSRLFRIADSHKTEFRKPFGFDPQIFGRFKDIREPEPESRCGLGYAFSRDVTDGRPSHIWAHALRDEVSCLFAMAGIVAYGNIANLDNSERELPHPKFAKAVDLGNKVSPAFRRTRPLRWAALLYSEAAKDALWADPEQAWKRTIYPVYGAWTALWSQRLPANVVVDSQLEQGLLDGYEILFVAAPDLLTDRMRASIDAFRKRGGLVVDNRSEWVWHDKKDGRQKAEAAFNRIIAAAAARAPVQAYGGPEKLHCVAFEGRDGARVTVALANPFTWVKVGAHRDTRETDAKRKESPAPPPCKDAVVVLRADKAPGRVLDMATGRALEVRKTDRGFEVAAPEFEALAVLQAEW